MEKFSLGSQGSLIPWQQIQLCQSSGHMVSMSQLLFLYYTAEEE